MTTPHPTRRTALLAAGAAVAPLLAAEPYRPKGNVKHSIVYWCFTSAGEKWDVDKTMCRVAKELGCVSVELIDPRRTGRRSRSTG